MTQSRPICNQCFGPIARLEQTIPLELQLIYSLEGLLMLGIRNRRDRIKALTFVTCKGTELVSSDGSAMK